MPSGSRKRTHSAFVCLVSDLPDLKIEFDVVVDAEIEITEGDYHYDEYDIDNQWFSVRCTGDLACNLDDFKIISIIPYQKGKMPQPLSDALVPYIYKEDLDKVAVTKVVTNASEMILPALE